MHLYTVTNLVIDDEDKQALNKAYTLCKYLGRMVCAKRVADGDTIDEITEEINELITELASLLDHDISIDLEYALKLKRVVDEAYNDCT